MAPLITAALQAHESVKQDRPVMGALLDPMGHKAEVLTEAEYIALHNHLSIRRSENDADEVLADFINSATFLFGKPASAEDALAWLAGMWMGDHHDSSDGLLLPRLGRTVTVLENEGEYDILQSVLAVLRAGGWFAEWIELQCNAIAKASTPADRYPSPLTIVSTLTEAIAEFEEQTETARAMVKLRPDLFPELKEAAHA
jgi:hypothetical protein